MASSILGLYYGAVLALIDKQMFQAAVELKTSLIPVNPDYPFVRVTWLEKIPRCGTIQSLPS